MKNGAMHTMLGRRPDYKSYNASKLVTRVLREKNYSKFTLFDNNREGIKLQVEFALDRAIRKGNWKAWYGWVGTRDKPKNSPTAGFNYQGKVSKAKRF